MYLMGNREAFDPEWRWRNGGLGKADKYLEVVLAAEAKREV